MYDCAHVEPARPLLSMTASGSQTWGVSEAMQHVLVIRAASMIDKQVCIDSRNAIGCEDSEAFQHRIFS